MEVLSLRDLNSTTGCPTISVTTLAHDALLGPPAEEELDEKSADIGIYD